MKLLKKLTKKNNKGFSLVELIVVILIMAIIAVALAPQVIKWVSEAQDSTEDTAKATLESAMLTVVAEWTAKGGKIASGKTISVTVTGNEVTAVAPATPTTDYTDLTSPNTLKELTEAALVNFKETTPYTVKIFDTGKIEITP